MFIEIEDKTLRLALMKAAGALGVVREQIEYSVIQESAGFFGLFGKKIRIKAWERQTFNQRSRATLTRTANKKGLLEAEEQRLQAFCQKLCSLVCAREVEVRAGQEGKKVVFDLDDDYLAEYIAKNSRFSDALEHILRKFQKKHQQDNLIPVVVDSRGSRGGREKSLIKMAQELSGQVYKNKRSITLKDKSSYDRKIIHMALDTDNRVYTKSVGVGFRRRLMIIPRRESQRGRN